ncbi:prepilin peptidase [Clostridium cylindrosporum]|uniref:Prepilin peptidase n=1 Tax=Clostridium cylindrosporum DSM 605 TaxID=1121307 RepID=A0A0J8DAH9_CLOCY|nr:A24 family peptidase [Clostridium cylindrosporum]KMT21329.1 hypothetical protein CLCY_2c00890 [Clostridium cylindrosporum DSM 605]
MEGIYGVFVFIIGSILGSFFNLCIFRIPSEESIVFPPSNCPKCKSNIKKYDLIPIISYLILRGKCRNCSEKVSIQYPLIELLTGILFTIIYLYFGFSVELFLYLVLVSVLIITSVIDINTGYIYERVSLVGIIAGVVFIVYKYISSGEMLTYILGGVAAGGIIAIIILLTNGMGWGDAEVAFLCGLFLGLSSSILMIFLSIVLGGIGASILLVFGKKSRKDAIPFAPYISIGGLIALLYGEGIVKAFLSYYGLY